MNFKVLWLFVKVFLQNLGTWRALVAAPVSNLQKFSLRKSYFPPICESFPLYGMKGGVCVCV